MAQDYSGMQLRILDEVQGENVDTTILPNIKNAIQDAIKIYRNKRLYFNQKTITFPTVAAQEYYGVGDHADIPNLICIDNWITLINGVKVEGAPPTTFDNIDTWQNGLVTGPPSWMAYFNQQIRLYPIPDTVYPIVAAIHYRLPVLSADDDTNAWMTDAEILIRQCAKRLLAADVIQEGGIAQGAGPIEMQALDELMTETAQRRSRERLNVDVYPRSQWGAGYSIYAGP